MQIDSRASCYSCSLNKSLYTVSFIFPFVLFFISSELRFFRVGEGERSNSSCKFAIAFLKGVAYFFARSTASCSGRSM